MEPGDPCRPVPRCKSGHPAPSPRIRMIIYLAAFLGGAVGALLIGIWKG